MAITATNLTSGADAVDRSSYTTASISPSSNKLVLLAVASSATPNSISGNGITWTSVTSVTQSFWTINLYRGMVSSPSSGTITIGFSGSVNQCAWSVDEFTNIDKTGTHGSGAIVQTSTAADGGTDSGITATLSAFSNTNNATYGAVFSVVPVTISVGSGFTQLGSANAPTEIEIKTEWKDSNDTTVDFSWGSASSDKAVIAAEIKHITLANSLFYQQI